MATGLLDKTVVQKERLDAMCRTFGKVGRVLSNRNDLTCTTVPTGPAPGWNDGRTVFFNEEMIGSVTQISNIVAMTGLFYHELCHVIFTPRVGSDFRKKIIDEGMHQAFNALEDQRIETLMYGKFPSTAPYFVNTFMKFCLSDEKQWESNHILAHGRRYLPEEVRKEFADRFMRQDLRKRFEKIIDAYRLCVFPRDMQKGLKLIREFNTLLNLINPPSMPYGHDMRQQDAEKNGRPAGQAEQEEAKDWAEWYESEEESDEDETEDSAEGSGGSGDNEDSEESDDDLDDGEGEGEGDDTDDENDGSGTGKGKDANSDSDEEGDDDGMPSEKTAGVGDGSAPEEGQNELRGLLEAVEKELLNNPDVMRDAKDKQRVILSGDGKTSQVLPTKRYNYTVPKEDMRKASVKFGKELEELRADLDPGWHTHKASGRINVQRAMQGVDLDTVFDQWDEGANDRADIECVLYVDFSLSMKGYAIQSACEALWTVKRAMERIDASVTVYAFNDESFIMYNAEDRADADKVRQIAAGGGTDPSKAIKDSLRIFANTKRSTKVAIFITDGAWGYGWYDTEDGWQRDIKKMNLYGITTALAYIGGYSSNGSLPESDRNGCSIGEYINNPMDLVPLARRIVKTVMKG